MNMTALKEVALHMNNIVSVADHAFRDVAATLKGMNLRNNNIRVITKLMFSGTYTYDPSGSTRYPEGLMCYSHLSIYSQP